MSLFDFHAQPRAGKYQFKSQFFFLNRVPDMTSNLYVKRSTRRGKTNQSESKTHKIKQK